MHIAFWSPAWPLEKFPNGIVTYVHWMKLALEERGHSVSVFAHPAVDQPGDKPWGERVYPVRRRLIDRVFCRVSSAFRPAEYESFQVSSSIAAAISKVHRREPIDLVEMEESFGWFADIERRIRLPVLVKLHGPAFLSQVKGEAGTPFGKEKIDREGRALRRASTIISPSMYTLSQTISHYGLKPARQEHIVNPIAVDPATPMWNLNGCDQKLILYVGRFDSLKGADVMLEAFRRLSNKRPDLRLVFVGPDRGVPGPDGRPLKFKEYLRALYPAEFHDRVDFRGWLPNQEVGILRTKAMVTVVASRSESQCYALLEAMLQCCPVVCTDGGACPESVTDGVTGLLARSGDPDSFAEKICEVLDNSKAAARMGEAARTYVLSRHSSAAVAEESIGLYRRAIG
jgi:glycosyltransferase involved in cell wall biosynthesis